MLWVWPLEGKKKQQKTNKQKTSEKALDKIQYAFSETKQTNKQKKLTIVFYDHAGIKMSITHVKFSILYSLSLYSFFALKIN